MNELVKRFRNTLSMSFTNVKGPKINQKIVVIESDDWGSIRMPNKVTRDTFESKGYQIMNNPYCRYDTLASVEDLTKLFSVLVKFKDKKGNHPVITANTVVANPDFDKIKKSNYTEYSYKPFTTTLEEYYQTKDVFNLWKEGMDSKVFIPQYHGREHVNVPLWLETLQSKNQIFVDAFDMRFWGVPHNLYDKNIFNIQAAYGSIKEEDIKFYKSSIKEGLNLFENIFNFKSKTFIANNYTWPMELDQTLSENGIEGIQGMKYQKVPTRKGTQIILNPLFTGKRNDFGQVYMVRNTIFEPSLMPKAYNSVRNCLRGIENSFLFKKPAVITSHRVNYIGAISPENRDQNLTMLEELLSQILKRWPDVVFMTSAQLADHLKK